MGLCGLIDAAFWTSFRIFWNTECHGTLPQVLSGALKDNKRATIVGESRTFGKGLIQTVVDLSDGSGVAVTVARYQTPLGIDINKVSGFTTPKLLL